MNSQIFPRRRLIQGGVALASLGLLAGCGGLPTLSGRPTRLPRVGHLSLGSSDAIFNGAFAQGLHEHGHVDGQTMTIDARYAEGKEELLPDLAAELVRLPADVIVTVGSQAAQAAQQATSTIPIVSIGGQQVETGFVASLARPDGNLTGLSLTFEGLRGKKVELLKEAIPGVTRVAILAIVGNAAHAVGLKEFRDAAQSLGVEARALEIRSDEDIESAVEAGTSGQVDGLIVQDDPFLFVHRARIVDLALRSRLPTMHGRREWVEAGGLMVHGVNFPAIFRRAAYYVDKLLKGAKPAELPVERPTTFDFEINLKTAQALGLTIPPSILAQATQVIQ